MEPCLKSKKGFTLIEILIVTAIVGILAAIAIPSYQYVINTAKRTSSIAALDIVRKELEVYMNDYGTYPKKIKFKNFTDQSGVAILSSGNWQIVNSKIYEWDKYKYKDEDGTYTLTAKAMDSKHTRLTLTPKGVTY